jgi:hypothetical protein
MMVFYCVSSLQASVRANGWPSLDLSEGDCFRRCSPSDDVPVRIHVNVGPGNDVVRFASGVIQGESFSA